MIMRWASK